jgi:hypothetical protein
MVDVKHIQSRLKADFKIAGTHHIDPVTGVVDVTGDVTLTTKVGQLPVIFGEVHGHFFCSNNSLTSLQGAPPHVGGDFFCYNNSLTSLQGAPPHVGGDFFCYNNSLTSLVGAPPHVGGGFFCYNNSLTSLVGAPHHVGGEFLLTYASDLPLLRLLTYADVLIYKAPESVKEILKRYKGQGKPGAIKAAAELIKAGYKENARW